MTIKSNLDEGQNDIGFLEDITLFENVKIVEESDKDNKKPMKISGVAGKGGLINKNSRLYPTSVYNKAVEKAQKRIREGKLLGQVDHPNWEDGDLSRASFKFTKLFMEGDLMKFEGDVLPTPSGALLETLLRSGVGVGVSTRGYGSLIKNEIGGKDVWVVQDDYEIRGIDFVLDQSNPYGKVQKFENEEGGKKHMTLEELKAKFPKLVESLKEEHEKELRTEIEKEISESLNEGLKDKLDEAKKEGHENGVKEVQESEEYKTAMNVLKLVKESIGTPKGEDELDEELQQAKKDLKKAEESLEEVNKELAKLKEEKAEVERKEKLAKAIENAVKDYEHADLLREQLEECTTADEVEKVLDKKKGLIEKIMAKAGIKEAKGTGETFTEDEDKETYDEDITRQRILAGLE